MNNGPTEKSLLLDMDNTIFDMESTWVPYMNARYNDITSINIYPMTEVLLRQKNILCAQYAQELVYEP